MKVYRQIGSATSEWRNYLVTAGQKKFRVAYSAQQRRFANSGDMQQLNVEPDVEEARRIIEADSAAEACFSQGGFQNGRA